MVCSPAGKSDPYVRVNLPNLSRHAAGFGPIFVDLGVHPVHFAIIMSVNLTVGLATPPMGLVLFVASSVSGEKVETIARAILPFLAVEVVVIFMITYIPAISMTIPRLTGFVQ